MARNRKYRSAAIRFGPALKAFLLCLMIGGSGIGYVWQKDQISRLGRLIKEREMRLAQLRDENEKRHKQLATMRSPAFLEMRIKELNLGLVAPQLSQILVLQETSPEPSNAPAVRQYAARATDTARRWQ
jgi:hypothetical protein